MSEPRTSLVTLTDALADYESVYMANRNLAKGTRDRYSFDLKHLFAFLEKHGIATVQQVQRTHLEHYVAELDHRGCKGTTRRRIVAAIRSFFGSLQDQEVVTLSPAQKLIPPALEHHQPRVLTQTEYKRLLEVARYKSTRDEAIIELLLQTGLRLSEVTQLCVRDVELPTKISRDEGNVGSVTVIGKGRRTRTVTLNYKASGALRRWLADRPDSDYPQVFLSKFRRPMSPRSIENAVTKYLQLAGIYNASVHTLRHTFATHHVRNGTGLKTVQQALGHASLKTTEIYVHLAREQMDKEMQKNAL